MDQQIRAQNLRLLVTHFHNQRELERLTGANQASISNALKGRRNIGDLVCRRIEENLGLPHKWMDAPNTSVPLQPHTPGTGLAAKPLIAPTGGLRRPAMEGFTETSLKIELEKKTLDRLIIESGMRTVDSSAVRVGPYTLTPDVLLDLGEKSGLLALDFKVITALSLASIPSLIDGLLARGLKYRHKEIRYLPILLVQDTDEIHNKKGAERLVELLEGGIQLGVFLGFAVATSVEDVLKDSIRILSNI